jgi:hypothetical protein
MLPLTAERELQYEIHLRNKLQLYEYNYRWIVTDKPIVVWHFFYKHGLLRNCWLIQFTR